MIFKKTKRSTEVKERFVFSAHSIDYRKTERGMKKNYFQIEESDIRDRRYV